jgi:acetylglutamate/LysW-gamma-L-alpha-aminoadipate kinase
LERRVVVVKVGGRLVANSTVLGRILDDAASLAGNMGLVLVHGGGDIVTFYSKRCGVEPVFVVSPSGIRSRYTSREELEVYVMVMAGKLNKEITASLLARGVNAVGVSGADCGLLRARRKKRIVVVNEKGRRQVVPGGYTGKIVGVNGSCLSSLLNIADAVVVAPVALGEEGEMLNVDGDQAAAHIAASLKADAVVFLTDVPGLMVDGRLVRRVSRRDVERLATLAGYGMNRKLLMAWLAVEGGAGRAVIADGRVEKPITRALEGWGTVVE